MASLHQTLFENPFYIEDLQVFDAAKIYDFYVVTEWLVNRYNR